MKNIIFIILLTCIPVYQNVLKPAFTIKASGDVSDFICESNKIYIATMQGKIDVYDVNTRRLLNQFKFKKITDFEGNLIDPRIYSIDKLPGDNKILTVLQAENGFQDVYLIERGQKTQIIDAQNHRLMIKRAKFINTDSILLGLFSDELLLWSISRKKIYIKSKSAYHLYPIILWIKAVN